MKPLHVITVISNPVRYRSRYELYRQFELAMKITPNVVFWTVEMAFGDRPFELTEPNDPLDIRLRAWTELWHKENMINIGISRLPEDWEYVAWIDADIMFTRHDWASETIHQLQHFMVVQMFQNAVDLGPDGRLIQSHQGFCYAYTKDGYNFPNKLKRDGYGYPLRGAYAHPGYAWAARREAIDNLGGLIDWAILGSADYHMATALVGQVEKSIPTYTSDRYRKKLHVWQDRAERFIQRDIGYTPGTIVHYWHGKKRDRQYADRWKIIRDNGYDPDLDLKRDYQGLFQLTDRSQKLRDQLRSYFRARNEDSIDIE